MHAPWPHRLRVLPALCQCITINNVCAGEFAEAVRDQFMTERQEHFAEVEQRIMDETLQQPDCTREQVAAALREIDVMTEGMVSPSSIQTCRSLRRTSEG